MACMVYYVALLTPKELVFCRSYQDHPWVPWVVLGSIFGSSWRQFLEGFLWRSSRASWHQLLGRFCWVGESPSIVPKQNGIPRLGRREMYKWQAQSKKCCCESTVYVHVFCIDSRGNDIQRWNQTGRIKQKSRKRMFPRFPKSMASCWWKEGHFLQSHFNDHPTESIAMSGLLVLRLTKSP